MFEVGQLNDENTEKRDAVRGHKSPGESLEECFKRVPLFANLSSEDLASFYAAAESRVCKKGTNLYVEKQPAEFFYVICSGWVKLFHALPEGKEAIVDMRNAGQLAGTESVFEQGLYTSNAQVAEEAEVIVIPLAILKEKLQTSSTLALGMLSFLSRHHTRQRTEAAFNAALCAPQRIGSFLLRLCPEDKQEDIVFHLPYDKTLIANTLGMTRGSFSRALSELKHESFIRIVDARVEIDSVEQLKNYVYRSLASKRSSKKQ